MKPFFKLFITFLLLVLLIITDKNVKSESFECTDFSIIFARGSGQKKNDVDFVKLKAELERELKNETFSFDVSELDYPAVKVSDFKTALGVVLSAGKSYKFGESVEIGEKNLRTKILSEAKKCPLKKFILAGYSQGAMVISRTLPNLNADKIIYVATFGDPKLYLPEGKNPKETACKSRGLSSYRVYVPDCYVDEGILGPTIPYQPAGYDNKLGTWCNKSDIICGSSLNITSPLAGHTKYTEDFGYQKAAKIIHSKIKTKNQKIETHYSNEKPKDIVVLYDFDFIADDYYRITHPPIDSELKKRLVAEAENGARVSIYNIHSASIGCERALFKKVDWTSDGLAQKIDEYNEDFAIYPKFDALNPYNNVFYAIKKLSKDAGWRMGADKTILVIGNQAHGNTEFSDDKTTADIALSIARENNVKVSFYGTLAGWNSNYNKIADGTGGSYSDNDPNALRFNVLKSKKLQPLSKTFSKTYKINQDSKYTLVIVNGVVYGISNNKQITIKDLRFDRENKITFIFYDEKGSQKTRKTYELIQSKPKAPDTSNAN